MLDQKVHQAVKVIRVLRGLWDLLDRLENQQRKEIRVHPDLLENPVLMEWQENEAHLDHKDYKASLGLLAQLDHLDLKVKEGFPDRKVLKEVLDKLDKLVLKVKEGWQALLDLKVKEEKLVLEVNQG